MGKVAYTDEIWSEISKEGKDLLKKMLTFNYG